MRISVRYQVLSIITLVLVGSMSAYLWLATRLVMKDKIAYVHEVNASVARAKSEELQGHLSSLAAKLDYFAASGACARSHAAGRALLETDDDLLAVEVWQLASGSWRSTCTVVDEDRLAMHALRKHDLPRLSPGADLLLEAQTAGGVVVRNSSLPPDRALLTLALQGVEGRFLVAHLHPGRMLPLFEESRSFRAWVVDRTGNVLLHPDAEMVVRRENLGDVAIVRDAFQGAFERGVREFEDDGTAWIGAFSRVQAGNLAVVTTVPRSVALSAMSDLARRSVLFAIGVVLVALLSAIFFSRRLTRPLLELENAASALAQGRLGHEVVVRSGDEIGRLATAFNRMSRELKDRESRLEDARAQLAQADRMALVGTLAAGIAHEINNPLTWINANLKFAASAIHQECRKNGQLREAGAALAEAITGAERVRAIVADLKIFSRKSEDRREHVDVRHTLDGALKMVGAELRRKARLVKEYSDVPPVHADEARLGQVFLNLVVNALQALPERSEGVNEVRVAARQEEASVVVEVSDNGVGIPPDVIGRIFDPFFTTKPVGVGTGLGLSICHGLVTALGGRISCRSTVGEGATFRVELPAAERGEARPEAPAADDAPEIAEGGSVLVVDDHAEVIGAIRRMLPSFEVEGAESFDDAVAKLSSRPFDFVLCDLLLPGRSGIELFHHARTTMIDVDARFVFMTGAIASAAVLEFLETVPNERIEKPFDGTTLLAAFAHTQEMRKERESCTVADGLRSKSG